MVTIERNEMSLKPTFFHSSVFRMFLKLTKDWALCLSLEKGSVQKTVHSFVFDKGEASQANISVLDPFVFRS